MAELGGSITLCSNCLESGAKGMEVGEQKGTQRDPWRNHIIVCDPCKQALLEGCFGVLHRRYRAKRIVRRDDNQQDGSGTTPTREEAEAEPLTWADVDTLDNLSDRIAFRLPSREP